MLPGRRRIGPPQLDHYIVREPLVAIESAPPIERPIEPCHIAMIYDVKNIFTFIIQWLPPFTRFKTALALTLIDRRMSTIVTEYLLANYVSLLTPLCLYLDTCAQDVALDILRRVVLPMRDFLFKGYGRCVEGSLGRMRLTYILRRLCHLTLFCNERCDDYRKNIQTTYKISRTVTETCGPSMSTLVSRHAHDAELLLNDVMTILSFLRKDIIYGRWYITRFPKSNPSVSVNITYIYRVKPVFVSPDDVEPCVYSPYMYPLERDYDQDDDSFTSWIDIRWLEPLIGDDMTIAHNANESTVLLLRVVYPRMMSFHGPSANLSGARLLSLWISSVVTLYQFKCAMNK